MTVDPDVAPLLEMLKFAPLPGPDTDIAAYRAMMSAAGDAQRGTPLPIRRVEEVAIPAAHGTIPARFYADRGPDAPLLLYFHGGGWTICNLDTHDDLCRRLAQRLGWQILSVDYRLAPEHPFPAAFDDGWDALQWISGAGRHVLGIRPTALVVGGDSAGGNIAAAVTIEAQDRGFPRIDHQLLLYPGLDPRMATGSIRENGEGYHLTGSALRFLWGQYLGDRAGDPPVHAAPALREDLAGLPPATIVVAALDPLRDEGREYADRLAAAGVPVAFRSFEGTIHGFAQFPHLASAQALMMWLEETLRSLPERHTG